MMTSDNQLIDEFNKIKFQISNLDREGISALQPNPTNPSEINRDYKFAVIILFHSIKNFKKPTTDPSIKKKYMFEIIYPILQYFYFLRDTKNLKSEDIAIVDLELFDLYTQKDENIATLLKDINITHTSSANSKNPKLKNHEFLITFYEKSSVPNLKIELEISKDDPLFENVDNSDLMSTIKALELEKNSNSSSGEEIDRKYLLFGGNSVESNEQLVKDKKYRKYKEKYIALKENL